MVGLSAMKIELASGDRERLDRFTEVLADLVTELKRHNDSGTDIIAVDAEVVE